MRTPPSGGVLIALTDRLGALHGANEQASTKMARRPYIDRLGAKSECWSQNLRFLRFVTHCVETIFD